MSAMIAYTKDPDALLDYTVNWASLLGNDTIASVAWVVPAGITQASAANTTTTATIWLSGGTDGVDYDVTCRVTTSGGRVDDRTIRIRVSQQ
jgi:hypothetical protein